MNNNGLMSVIQGRVLRIIFLLAPLSVRIPS